MTREEYRLMADIYDQIGGGITPTGMVVGPRSFEQEDTIDVMIDRGWLNCQWRTTSDAWVSITKTGMEHFRRANFKYQLGSSSNESA